MAEPSLAQQLGYSGSDRLVIIACDDLGYSSEVNQGVFAALHDGAATSASLMTTCAATFEAMEMVTPTDDIGVHLTLTCDDAGDHWRPLTTAAGFADHDGYLRPVFPSELSTAILVEVMAECSAQVEYAIDSGVDVTHLDSHQNVIVRSPLLADLYLELARKYRLPARRLTRYKVWRVAGKAVARRRHHAPRARAQRRSGVVTPDYVVALPFPGPARDLPDVLSRIGPGVTEICMHPASDSARLRDTDQNWATRVAHLESLLSEAEISEMFSAHDLKAVGYRELREVQRANAPG